MTGRINTSGKLAAGVLLLLSATQGFAQVHGLGGGKVKIQEGLGGTWKGPSASVFNRILTRRAPSEKPSRKVTSRRSNRPVADSPVPSGPEVVKFRPGPDTGIGDMLAAAFTTNPSERSVLQELFRQLKQSYETEVAKDGKSNDLAAAMTFFIASNVVAYYNSDMPSDAATEGLYNTIRSGMASTTEIERLTNSEKQKVHDWLVYMGGFVLAGHVNAKNTNDRLSLADFKAIADQSMRLVLGVGPDKFTPGLRSLSLIDGPGQDADQYTSRISTASPTLAIPRGCSPIRFCPKSTLPFFVRKEASVFSGSFPSFMPVA